jgi:hypothetical protein
MEINLLFNIQNATSRTVAGPIPDEGRTMCLGSTEPLTETSTRNLAGIKGRLAPSLSHLSINLEGLDVSQPYGPVQLDI